MGQFTRTRVRCEVYPNRVGIPFTVQFTGQNPKIYKGAGCDFEIALFDKDGELFNVSNVAGISVLVRNASGSTLMTKTVSVINAALDIEAWQNGSGAHAVISFTGAEAAVAAAVNHAITVHGVTSDAGADPDVFGTSILEVIDAGITAITAPIIDPATGVTFEALTALLGSYVPYMVPPGRMITFQSEDEGRVKRTMGVKNSSPAGPTPTAQRVDEVESES